jgi:hypothetical protein
VLNSVNGISFKGATALDKISNEQLYAPGLYAMPEVSQPSAPLEKKGSFLGFLGKTVATALLIGVAAVGARKFLMKDYKVIELADDAKSLEKIKNTFAKYTDKLYDVTVGKISDKFAKKTIE